MESNIADTLKKLQKEADEFDIQIGSYPKWKPEGIQMNEWKHKVTVSVLGKNEALVHEYALKVKNNINGFEVTE